MGSRHLEDLRRILQGVAAVAYQGAADSTLLRRLVSGDLLQPVRPLQAAVRVPVPPPTEAHAPQTLWQQQQPLPSTQNLTAAPAPATAAHVASAEAVPAAVLNDVVSAATQLRQPQPAVAASFAAAQAGPIAAPTPPPEAAIAASVPHWGTPPAAPTTAAAEPDAGAGEPAAFGGSSEPEVHGLQGVTLFEQGDGTQQQQAGGSSGAGAGMGAGAATTAAAAGASPAAAAQQQPAAAAAAAAAPPRRKFVPRERAVPSSSMGRVLGFAQLGTSLLYGTVRESVSRALGGSKQQQASDSPYSSFMTEDNAERLANALCRMRGAALKLGQMLSIQDENVLPPQFQAALERVRAGADVMPRKQLEKVLVSQLGADWQTKVAEFDFQPMAAASIGQVHSAVLHDGRRAVMKIQYPGVARSIESDVDNLMRLISVANLLPKGLYVENAVKVAKRELKMECDYRYELQSQQRFKQLIASDPYTAQHFHVPDVVPELSTEQVLASEWVPGVHIDKVADMSQGVRDDVGAKLLKLTLKELFHWRYMQTDPNWGNFLYDPASCTINLIDFGAARDYPPHFVSDYLHMVRACADRDRQEIIERSTSLGFLTGDESTVMLDAHVEAGIMVGLPFGTQGVYDFGSHGGMTRRVSELGAVMLKHRLTPPPDESYSLHRKLSGAFLACIKLKARVPCRQLFLEAFDVHEQLAQQEQQHTLEVLQQQQQHAAAAVAVAVAEAQPMAA